MIQYLPNAISLARGLCTLPVAWLIIGEHWTWAFWTALAAGLSDLLDGWLAKRFSLQSRMGAALDGLADKTLLFGIFLALAIVDRLPLWWFWLVVSRDAIIVVGAWFYNRWIESLKPAPTWLGKSSTATQIALALVVLADSSWQFQAFGLERYMLILAVLLTVVSGSHYVILWARRAWNRRSP